MSLNRIINVEVTEELIVRSRQIQERNSHNCAIALALKEITNLDWGVNPSGCFTKRYGRVDFPREATAWIERFDSGLKVRPISFFIMVPRI